jgi:hypothetical protein
MKSSLAKSTAKCGTHKEVRFPFETEREEGNSVLGRQSDVEATMRLSESLQTGGHMASPFHWVAISALAICLALFYVLWLGEREKKEHEQDQADLSRADYEGMTREREGS